MSAKNPIGEARRAAGLSQGQLAEKAGISLGNLRKLENGQRKIMCAQLDTILPIARALGVTVEELVKDIEE